MTIGDNIKTYRKQNKLTQKELGDLINKSTISVRKYEANDITPSISVLNDIASALNITINDLTEQGYPRLHNLNIYEDLDALQMFSKLLEEVSEVNNELIFNDNDDDLASELLDVMQCCIGIAYARNVDLNNYIENHNKKLLSRGHEFI